MEKTVKVGEKTYVVKELKYKDVAKLGNLPQEESAKLIMQGATGMSDEEYEDLGMREGIEIQKAINEVNGLGTDFQVPPTAQPQSS